MHVEESFLKQLLLCNLHSLAGTAATLIVTSCTGRGPTCKCVCLLTDHLLYISDNNCLDSCLFDILSEKEKEKK